MGNFYVMGKIRVTEASSQGISSTTLFLDKVSIYSEVFELCCYRLYQGLSALDNFATFQVIFSMENNTLNSLALVLNISQHILCFYLSHLGCSNFSRSHLLIFNNVMTLV